MRLRLSVCSHGRLCTEYDFKGMTRLFLKIFSAQIIYNQRKRGGGRNRPFMSLISSELCMTRQSNQANLATTQSNPFNTLWCPFWCPPFVGLVFDPRPTRRALYLLPVHNNGYYWIFEDVRACLHSAQRTATWLPSDCYLFDVENSSAIRVSAPTHFLLTFWPDTRSSVTWEMNGPATRRCSLG